MTRHHTHQLAIVLAAIVVAASCTTVAAPPVETVRLKSGDIELATDIYHATKEPAPVILVRTPYGKAGHDFIAEAFAARGYTAVIQDVRGKYDSGGGEHEPFVHERSDGLATLKWLAKQRWCNGRIGMWGQSYSGYASLVLADIEMKELASIMSFSGWLEAEDVVSLNVYDVRGKLVESLVSGAIPAGEHVVEWNAGQMPSGIYFYRLKVGNFTETRKLILLK